MHTRLNEDIEALTNAMNNPNSVNAVDRVRDAVYSILSGLSQLGKTYPTIRFAVRKAIQDYLRSGA